MHYELIVVVVCLIKFLLQKYIDYKDKILSQEQVPTKVYQAKTNKEIKSLLIKKAEMQSGMEEFNNPTSFAKYSKMQRQLVKINKQIEELSKKHQEIEKEDRIAFENQQVISKQKQQDERAARSKRRLVIRLIVHGILIKMFWSFRSLPIILANEFPLSLISSDEGTISCGYIYLACSFLLK